MNGKILVIGSSNTDMVINTKRFPSPGETVIGGTFFMNPGGKGANQAVTAARLGGHVTFIAKVGNDIFGRQALQQFQREEIDNKYVAIDADYPSGVALIHVDSKGENCISVAPGCNGQLRPADVDKALALVEQDTIVLLQLEIPVETVEYVIREAYSKGLKVLLNPAPAQSLPTELFELLYMITPNESEAELLTGIKIVDVLTAQLAARKLHKMGVPNIVITLGASGAYLHNEFMSEMIPAPVVEPIDTTGAGDCFNGALAVALAENKPLKEAMNFACKVAAISVTRLGAQSSIPYRKEIDAEHTQK